MANDKMSKKYSEFLNSIKTNQSKSNTVEGNFFNFKNIYAFHEALEAELQLKKDITLKKIGELQKKNEQISTEIKKENSLEKTVILLKESEELLDEVRSDISEQEYKMFNDEIKCNFELIDLLQSKPSEPELGEVKVACYTLPTFETNMKNMSTSLQKMYNTIKEARTNAGKKKTTTSFVEFAYNCNAVCASLPEMLKLSGKLDNFAKVNKLICEHLNSYRMNTKKYKIFVDSVGRAAIADISSNTSLSKWMGSSLKALNSDSNLFEDVLDTWKELREYDF